MADAPLTSSILQGFGTVAPMLLLVVVIAFGMAYLNGKLKRKVNRSVRNRKQREKKELYEKYSLEKKTLGDAYESYVGKRYEDRGYIVKYNGFEKGVEDGGIDLIAIKPDEIVFIQCKNWSKGRKRVNMQMVKAFETDVSRYIAQNKVYANYQTKNVYAISNPILDKAAYAYIKNSDGIEFELLKMGK